MNAATAAMSRPRPSLPVAALLGATLLAACGQAPATVPQRQRVTQQALPAAPAPLAPVPTGAGAGEPTLRARVDAAVAKLDAVRSISGKLAFREFKASEQDHGDAAIAFRRKPFAARVDVLESNRLIAHGGALLWKGGTTIQIKPLKMPFTLDFSWEDAKVVSLRGYRIDQTDIFSMGKVLRHPAAQLKDAGVKRLRGETLYCVDVVSPSSLPDVKREVIGLSATHGIPVYREMYDAQGRLVHQGQGYELQIDRPVPADRFEL